MKVTCETNTCEHSLSKKAATQNLIARSFPGESYNIVFAAGIERSVHLGHEPGAASSFNASPEPTDRIGLADRVQMTLHSACGARRLLVPSQSANPCSGST